MIAGSEGSTERAWFLRRVAPSTNIVNGITNVVVTNVWAQRLYGPGPTDFQINPQPWRANVRGLVAVQAWEKGELARPEMRFDAGSLESRMSEQVYPSKEGSSGGTGVGGGGCGCN